MIRAQNHKQPKATPEENGRQARTDSRIGGGKLGGCWMLEGPDFHFQAFGLYPRGTGEL